MSTIRRFKIWIHETFVGHRVWMELTHRRRGRKPFGWCSKCEKCFVLILLCALPALAAPPVLPTYTPKPRPLKHTAGSKVGALERTAYAVVIRPAKGMRWTWPYTFSPPQFSSFRFYGRSKVDGPRVLLGTNSVPVWIQQFTNGPVQLIDCVAIDADMRYDSRGAIK